MLNLQVPGPVQCPVAVEVPVPVPVDRPVPIPVPVQGNYLTYINRSFIFNFFRNSLIVLILDTNRKLILLAV